MLGKLLKYDIKAEFKSLLPIYLVAIIMPVAVRIMDVVANQFPILNTFYGLLLFMYVMVLIGIFVWTLVVAVRYFYNNILKDEGYLTNTLPVKRSYIILSKEIVSLLTFTVSTVVFVVSLMIGIYHGGVKEILEGLSQLVSIHYGLDTVGIIVWVIATLLISYVTQIQIFYLAMLLGQTRNANKVIFSFVFGIIIYTILQFVSLLSIGIDYIIFPNMMDILDSSVSSVAEIYSAVTILLGTTFVLEVICLIAMHYISVYLVNNKLNLE